MSKLTRSIWFVWLLGAILGVLSVSARGRDAAPHGPTTDYDGQTYAKTVCVETWRLALDYDSTSIRSIASGNSSVFGYDGVAVLIANECRNQPADTRTPFVDFAKFLAAGGDMVTVVHYTDEAGVQAITQSGTVGTPQLQAFVTTPSQIPVGATSVQVEQALEIQAGKGQYSITFQTPSANLMTPANGAVTSGGLPEQNLTTSWQFDPRGYVTNYVEQFASTNTGPTTTVQRTFDAYGQLAVESVNGGAFAYGTSQSWDATGRRTILNIGAASYGFGWRADGSLTYASNPTGNGIYTHDTAGVLTSRVVGNRSTSITTRDGEGRPLTIATTLNQGAELNETLAWSGDGLLTNHTVVRGDFTDNRLYSYGNLSRRLTQEQLNLNATNLWTNSFAYDQGVTGGPGALTTLGPTNSNFGRWWSGLPDAFSRINAETNNSIGLLASGSVNGQATLSAWLDNQAVQILDVGTNAMQWRTLLELSPGPHQLTASALHPSGLYTAWATNAFTNNIPYQVTTDTYDGGGNITNRVYRNASGATNRTQSLSWDAKGRLRQVIELATNNDGFLWSATYDGLNRRIATTTVLVSNGVPSTVPPQILNSYYDPQVEFLELGVLLSSAPQMEFQQPGTSTTNQTVWKLYGPDLDGTYGGENGTGGLEGVSPNLNSFNPVISDARGNVLAELTNGAAAWTPARPTGYGAVPGYRPVAYGNGVDLAQACAFRGREVDVTGYHHFGMRDYDPVSGQWLSYDPAWNDRDPNGQSFCGGDPINGFDADGRISSGFYQSSLPNTADNLFGQDSDLAGLYQDYLKEQQNNYIVSVAAAGSTYLSGYGDISDVLNAVSGGSGTDFESWLNDAVQGFLKGGYADSASGGTAAGQTVSGFVPGYNIYAGGRDWTAAVGNLGNGGWQSGGRWLAVGAATAGMFPGLAWIKPEAKVLSGAGSLEQATAAETTAARTASGDFYSVASETELSPTSYPGVSRYMHFKEANTALDAAMNADADFAATMDQLGISVPRSSSGSILGTSPENWVWHHDTEAGIMQLVPKSQHPNIPGGIFWETMHPGGNGGFSIWGQ